MSKQHFRVNAISEINLLVPEDSGNHPWRRLMQAAPADDTELEGLDLNL